MLQRTGFKQKTWEEVKKNWKGKILVCRICEKKFYRMQSQINSRNQKELFCSKQCSNARNPKVKQICVECKKEFDSYKSSILNNRGHARKWCSMICYNKNRKTKFVQTKKRKKLKKNTLKKVAWIYFSKYIRQRDKGVCISCGKPDEYKNTDAGHYIPKTAGLSIYFDERNVNCQCVGCNRFRHGNLSAYAVALRKKYGENILEELDEQRKKIKQITAQEYIAMIETYKNKLVENGFELGTGKRI